MKIKTSELTGIALDYAVAVCENRYGQVYIRNGKLYEPLCEDYLCYTTDYVFGGPIIERECINLTCCYDKTTWFADIDQPDTADVLQKGETLLIAAMRCYVASKLGDTVEIPNELL